MEKDTEKGLGVPPAKSAGVGLSGSTLRSGPEDGTPPTIPHATTPDTLRVSGWVIHSEGDWSVGIPDGRWEVKGEMWFNDAEEKEEFRSKLSLAFEYVCDPVSYVKTFEEEKAMFAAEQAHYDRMDKEWNELNSAKP